VTVVTVIGVGRVALTAAAAQTSMDSSKLRKEIKAARYEGDMLEVQQSALAAPSRVRKLAGADLALGEPKSVCYLGLDGAAVCEPKAKPKAKKPAPTAAKRSAGPAKRAQAAPKGVDALVQTVIDVAAGEAQLLLVGDVGIASSR